MSGILKVQTVTPQNTKGPAAYLMVDKISAIVDTGAVNVSDRLAKATVYIDNPEMSFVRVAETADELLMKILEMNEVKILSTGQNTVVMPIPECCVDWCRNDKLQKAGFPEPNNAIGSMGYSDKTPEKKPESTDLTAITTIYLNEGEFNNGK